MPRCKVSAGSLDGEKLATAHGEGGAAGWCGVDMMTTLLASTVFDPAEVPYTTTSAPTATSV
jgi:hypothetical protein